MIPNGWTAFPWHLQLLNTSAGLEIYPVFTDFVVMLVAVVMKRKYASEGSKKNKPGPQAHTAASCRNTGVGRCSEYFITGNSPVISSVCSTACSSRLGQQAANPQLTLTVLFSLCNRCTGIWRNGWCISIQWQLPHTWGSIWQGDMWLKLAHLHPLSWDKSKSLILLPVTAVLCYAVTWLKLQKKSCIPSVKMLSYSSTD